MAFIVYFMERGIIFNRRSEERIDRYMSSHGMAMDPRTVIHNMFQKGMWPRTEQTPKRLSYYFRVSGKYSKVGTNRPFTYVWNGHKR